MKKKISIHDIARQLEVSSATVSFVLNGKAAEKRISSDMEKKILKHVKKLGYRPNRLAKSLRTGKSKIIGMLMEDISDPFFSSIARVIEVNAHKHDYKVFYASTENNNDIARELIGIFRDTPVDGYIIAPSPGIQEDIRELMNDNLPVVLYDRYFPKLSTTNIVVDNFAGAYNAVQHFLENGYKHIGFVTSESKQTQMTDRLKGYTKAMEEKGLTTCIEKIPFRLGHEKSAEKIREWMQQNPELDAVLFATNYFAISGLEAIHTLKLRIPADVGVIGFDDNTHFSLFSPSITAVAQPIRDISEKVFQQLLLHLNGQEVKKETIVLSTPLMIRESSVRAKK